LFSFIYGIGAGLALGCDTFHFKERFTQLKAEFEEQVKEESALNERIAANLLKVKIDE